MTSDRVTRRLPHFSHFGTTVTGALLPRALLGTVAASYIIQSFSSDFFTMQYAVVAMAMLLTVAVSVAPAIRRVNRMNLAKATKVLT